MSRMFSIKSAAVLCVATLVMCFSATDANAQCRGGGYGVGYVIKILHHPIRTAEIHLRGKITAALAVRPET